MGGRQGADRAPILRRKEADGANNGADRKAEGKPMVGPTGSPIVGPKAESQSFDTSLAHIFYMLHVIHCICICAYVCVI